MAPCPLVMDKSAHIDHSPATIAIKQLQLPHPVIAPNVWGIAKEQPGYLDIYVNLKDEFQSAADIDALDDSTIHYGQLAKRIRQACEPGTDSIGILNAAEAACTAMGTKACGQKCIISRTYIDLDLPKASMYGELLRLRHWREFDESGGGSMGALFELLDLKFMGLIGVNDYERSAKQPIIASVSISKTFLNASGGDFTGEQLVFLHSLERKLADTVQHSSFETLESLADVATKDLMDALVSRGFGEVCVSLRLEKPKAIAFADAAVVELRRFNSRMEQAQMSTVPATQSTLARGLKILRPYV